jgi:homoaconitase
VNDEGGDVNVAFDHSHDVSQPESDSIPNIAKRLKSRNQPWALVVDDNYGEGSAREHAALQPRFYGMVLCSSAALGLKNLCVGCAMIVARSFARIHETNLKVKQC